MVMTDGCERTKEGLQNYIESFKLFALQGQETYAEITSLVTGFAGVQLAKELKKNTLKELESNVTERKKCLNKLQIKKSECEKNYLQGKEECTRLKEKEETLKEELKDTCAAVSSLKEDIDHLHDGTKTSKKDAAILERNRYLLRLYKNLTGLKWDYSALSSDYAGSVFNPVNNYCKYFHHPAAEASAELVWDEIKTAAHAVWQDIGQEPLNPE